MQSLRCDILHAFSLSMCMQKNIYEWVRDHCLHHKYVCTDADPHNASQGFFFSHIGWLLVQEHPDCTEKKQKLSLSDLTTDKVVMFQKRHFVVSMLVLWFLLPMLVPWYFWGESLVVGCFVPGLLRHVAVLNATWLVNSVAHMWGNRPYDKNINPRENKFVSFSAIGEGFRNYHHTFPYDYAASEFGSRLNLTTAFINLMCALGLAKDPKTVSKETIVARMRRTGDGNNESNSCK
ncbi:stearoyl-CoA desaturase b [Haplochromis burtoni]|uniref:stearoyl-CoA desaturase b n=1 Tax=Haplochromis burtoni TaxID=8153 RepID=UPI0003BD0B23|nr:stearoyl-CoA desaturase b [Haplochromis burtoni]